jgi:AraC-like DNA-binding protein
MRSTLLSRWPLLESADPGEAFRSLNALWAPGRVSSIAELSAGAGHFQLNGFADAEFAIGFISTDLALEGIVSTERDPSYFLTFGIFGEVRFEVGRRHLMVTRATAAVVNPDERLVVLPERRPTGTLAIRLRRQLVARELTALLGEETGTDPRFALALDLAQPGTSGMRAVLRDMLGQLDSKHHLLAQPGMRRAAVRTLVTGLLLAHQHTHTELLRDGTTPLRSRHLARAIEYIEDHLAEQITLGDIAQAAGRSARTVSAAFRSHLGVSPMTHVRNRRLERVRRALLTSQESTSVIALDAGFTHLGRFAAAYRERFGELPSATRSRR